MLTKGFLINVPTPSALAMMEPDQRESPNVSIPPCRAPSSSRNGMPHSWSRTTSEGRWERIEKTVWRLSWPSLIAAGVECSNCKFVGHGCVIKWVVVWGGPRVYQWMLANLIDFGAMFRALFAYERGQSRKRCPLTPRRLQGLGSRHALVSCSPPHVLHLTTVQAAAK